jgi:zinc transport system substrate-binding protein
MRKPVLFILFIVLISCNRSGSIKNEKIISVSIPPFRYFVEAIADSDFTVNILVPAGSNPHIYEPVPEQITRLSKSVAYISDGYLGFEITWLDRFYEMNKTMKRISLGDKIDLIKSQEAHDSHDIEGADPHFWVSPKCALIIASDIRSLVTELNPARKEKYDLNYTKLIRLINSIDSTARERFSGHSGQPFMIFHPTLDYLARDYGLTQVAVENEGKEPTPAYLRGLIDIVRDRNIKVIFVQREYDTKNAGAIASETGAMLEMIDPLSEKWDIAEIQIIEAIAKSLSAMGK